MEPIFQSDMQTECANNCDLPVPSCSSIIDSSLLGESPQQIILNSNDAIKLSKTYVLSDGSSTLLRFSPSLEHSAVQRIRVMEAGHLNRYNALSEVNVPLSAVQVHDTTAHSIATIPVTTDVRSSALTPSSLINQKNERGNCTQGYVTLPASSYPHPSSSIAPLHVMPISGTHVNIQIIGGIKHHDSMSHSYPVCAGNFQSNQMVASINQPLIMGTQPCFEQILTCVMVPTTYVMSIPHPEMVPVTQVIIPQTSGNTVGSFVQEVYVPTSQEQNTDTGSKPVSSMVSNDKDVNNSTGSRKVITSETEFTIIQNLVAGREEFKSTVMVENIKTFLPKHGKNTTPKNQCGKAQNTDSKDSHSHVHETDYITKKPIILNKRQLHSPNGSFSEKHQKLNSFDHSSKYSICKSNSKQNSDVILSNCSNSVKAIIGNDNEPPTCIRAIITHSNICEENLNIVPKGKNGMVSLLHSADTIIQSSKFCETSAVSREIKMVGTSLGYLQNQSFSVDSLGNFVTQSPNQQCNSSVLAPETDHTTANLPSIPTSIPYVLDSNRQQVSESLPNTMEVDVPQATILSLEPYASGIETSSHCNPTPSMASHHEGNESNKLVSFTYKIPQQREKSYRNPDMTEDSHEHSRKDELNATVGKSNIAESMVKLTPDGEHYPLVEVNNSVTQQEGLAWNKMPLSDRPLEMTADLKDNKMECNLCNATFTKLGNYTRHQMIHTVGLSDSFRYSCHECNRSFLQQCDLRRHVLIHKDQQPHRCQVCGKGYIRRSDLVIHLRFHNQERMFKCPQCTKSFFQSGDLKRHIRNIHQRMCMLTCGHCTNTFVTEQTLLRHVQMKHKDFIITSIQEKMKSKCSQFTLAVAKRDPHQDSKSLGESLDAEEATGIPKADQDHPTKDIPASKHQDGGQTNSRKEENFFDDQT